MGKKGKQRGVSKAEADRFRAAAAASRISHFVDPRYGQSSSAAAGPARGTAAPKSELQKLREERGIVSLTHLRGLLRDRQREDTMEYQQARRRQMTASLRVESSKNKTHLTEENDDSTFASRCHKPGWVLYRDGGGEKQMCTEPRTLQSLCVASLGPVLTDYLLAYGVDVLTSIFSTLPPNVLAELSVKVSECGGVDDQLVQALGSHNHVDGLALHSAGPGKMTAAGILSIVPRACTATEATTCTSDGEIASSWEESSWEDVHQTLQIEGCCRMTKLELCNFQAAGTMDDEDDEDADYERALKAEEEMEDALLSLLRLCPRITHLSIASSFQFHPHRLFQSIPALLPSLQVLDLSCCVWMDDAILLTFVRATGLERRGSSSLALVDVSSCPNITDKGVNLANEIAYCMLGLKDIVQRDG